MSENIKISEGDAPLLTFQIKQRQSDSSLVPYPLGGVTEIAFVAKPDPNLADNGTGCFSYTKTAAEIVITADGSAVGAKYSEITVQFAAANTTTPRNLYYRIKVTKSGRIDTVKTGFLEIANV